MIGTIASIIVLISFLMNNERMIRIVNILGALVFVIYGILIKSFSVTFLNGMLILINICYLKKIKN